MTKARLLKRASVEGRDDDNVEIIKLLLQNGADPNTQNHTGETTLIVATRNNNYPETIDLLLQAGANPHIQDNNGNTALLYAFPDQQTLVITTNEQTFNEIFERLTTSKTVR